MNKDVWAEILMHSDAKDIVNLCYVSHEVNKICNDRFFWEKKFKQEQLPVNDLPLTGNYLQQFTKIYNLREASVDLFVIINNDINLNGFSKLSIDVSRDNFVNLPSFLSEHIEEIIKALNIFNIHITFTITNNDQNYDVVFIFYGYNQLLFEGTITVTPQGLAKLLYTIGKHYRISIDV